jgi:3-ketosteroid 9alpha-monooxygenase subunit A
MARFPYPPYPASWYAVAFSRQLRPGKALPARYFGRDLVVWRGQDGAARVMDAHCPHLGAHLGHGRVVDNTIRCPFHAWRFDGEGSCVDVPYAPRIPPNAQLRCWPVREANGLVMVHFHEQGHAPAFELPTLPQYGAAGWTRAVDRTVDVRSHVQEMNENVFDQAHFIYIHHYAEMPAVTIEDDGPVARVTHVGSGTMYGRTFRTETVNTMYGAGLLTVHVRSAVEFMVIVAKTPIDEERVEHRYSVIMKRFLGPIGRLLRAVVVRQVTADVMTDRAVWEHKAFLPKPILVKTDGPIMRFRKWHRQFYPLLPVVPSTPDDAPRPLSS